MAFYFLHFFLFSFLQKRKSGPGLGMLPKSLVDGFSIKSTRKCSAWIVRTTKKAAATKSFWKRRKMSSRKWLYLGVLEIRTWWWSRRQTSSSHWRDPRRRSSTLRRKWESWIMFTKCWKKWEKNSESEYGEGCVIQKPMFRPPSYTEL